MMGVFRKKLYNVIESVFIIILSIITLFLFFYLFKYIEGKYFPVIKNVELSYQHTTQDNFAIYNIYFEKIRQCKPILEKFSWYMQNRNGFFDRVYFELPEEKGSPNRPNGKNITSGWKVDIMDGDEYQYDIHSKQEIIFYHSCLFGLSEVKTILHVDQNKIKSIEVN